MFKIARTVKQIFNVARNIPKAASASINSVLKYSTQSKGYILEDAGEEFTFLKALPSQLSNASIQDNFKAFNPNLQNIAKTKSTQLLDSAEIRKLIYARFADEIANKCNNIIDIKNIGTKECMNIDTISNINDAFEALRKQGYNFKELRDSIADYYLPQSKSIEEKSSRDNGIGKSIGNRMKELSISGHILRYAGESGLKEEVEKLMHKKALVIEEFMQKVNDAAVSDICKAELLGEV